MSGQLRSGKHQDSHKRHGPAPAASAPTPSNERAETGPFGEIARLQATVGNQAVSRMLDRPVVQRILPGDTFRNLSGGDKRRKKVLSVDDALKAFHKVDGKDYKGRKQAADALITECQAYLGRSGRSAERKAGVRMLLAQATAESDLYDRLANTEGLEYGARLAVLLDINERASSWRAKLDHQTSASPDIQQAVEKMILQHDKANPEVLEKVMAMEVAHLREIAADETAPKIVRSIVAENLSHIDKIHLRAVEAQPAVTGPGAREAKPKEDTGGKAYVVNHQLIQIGGAAERTGSLVHELTHVAAGETFAHAPLFVIFKKGKQNTEGGRKEIKALAMDRKAKADKLEALVESSDLRPDQKGLVIGKIAYGKKSKLGDYLSKFEGLLGGKESPEYLGLKQLALDPDILAFDATLVEYDSVINQVVLYFHEWAIPQDEPAYALARDLATEAQQYRAAQGG